MGEWKRKHSGSGPRVLVALVSKTPKLQALLNNTPYSVTLKNKLLKTAKKQQLQ